MLFRSLQMPQVKAAVAQHALVLGPGNNVNHAFQSDSIQESIKSKSPCLAPRASAIKEQGFSEAVAA